MELCGNFDTFVGGNLDPAMLISTAYVAYYVLHGT